MDEIRNAEEVLLDLVETIDSVGGILINENGYAVPVCDQDWVDLGEVYLEACKILNRFPMVEEG